MSKVHQLLARPSLGWSWRNDIIRMIAVSGRLDEPSDVSGRNVLATSKYEYDAWIRVTGTPDTLLQPIPKH